MKTLKSYQENLSQHSLFNQLTTLPAVQFFMECHVFAVWDFMSLLKSIQLELTGMKIPWRPSSYDPKIVRLMNEIVLGEESDLDFKGEPKSHFELYLEAMNEVGADTFKINNFLKALDPSFIPVEVKPFVLNNLKICEESKIFDLVVYFFYGREKIIPGMFEQMIKTLEKNELNCPTLHYYLKRHIEVDGEDHGPKAKFCLDYICHKFNVSSTHLESKAIEAMEWRKNLWDNIESSLIKMNRPLEHGIHQPGLNR
jgi:hypothetical protein